MKLMKPDKRVMLFFALMQLVICFACIIIGYAIGSSDDPFGMTMAVIVSAIIVTLISILIEVISR